MKKQKLSIIVFALLFALTTAMLVACNNDGSAPTGGVFLKPYL